MSLIRLTIVAVCAGSIIAPAAVSAQTARVRPLTSLVSTTSEPIPDFSIGLATSSNGRWTVFATSPAVEPRERPSTLTNVFVRDRRSRAAITIDLQSAVEPSTWNVSGFAISADGSTIALTVNELTSESVSEPFVFLYDVRAKTSRRLAPGERPVLSRNARYIAFVSIHRLSAADTNDHLDLYLYDQHSGEYETLTTLGGDSPAEFFLDPAGVSDDGQSTAFVGCSSGYVEDDTNGECDVFVRNRTEGTTRRVSVTSTGAESNGRSEDAAMSGNGRVVVFTSAATNLVPNDINFDVDVFAHDLVSGVTSLVSVDRFGRFPRGGGFGPTISADGRLVAFLSPSMTLIPQKGLSNVYVHDRLTGITEGVDLDSRGKRAGAGGMAAAIGAAGRHVAFITFAAILPGDADGQPDAYLRDRGTYRPIDYLNDALALVATRLPPGAVRGVLSQSVERALAATHKGVRQEACARLVDAFDTLDAAWNRAIRSADAASVADILGAASSSLACGRRGHSPFDFQPSFFTERPHIDALSIATADFNSDGFVDVALSAFVDEAVSPFIVAVYLGDGAGSFADRVDFPSCGQSGIIARDVSGDGKPDLAMSGVSADGEQALCLLINTSSKQGVNFAPSVLPTATPFPVLEIAAADITGDGIVDLVTAQHTSELALFVGRGSGRFSRAGGVSLNFEILNVQIADFNRDGTPDIAALGSGGVSILLGTGRGTFSSARHVASGSFSGLVLADFNSDGQLDLATSGFAGIHVFVGRGDGGFLAPTHLEVGALPITPLVAADLDVDGWIDVATIAAGGIVAFRGHGDGTFGPLYEIADVSFRGNLGAADVNGDGMIDLVSTDTRNRLEVLLNRPPVYVTSPNSPTSWAIGSTQTIGWRHRLARGTTFHVEVSRNGGSRWERIAVVTPRGPSHLHRWTVTGPPTMDARLRVIAATNPQLADINSASVRIGAPVIAFANLVGGPWGIGTARVIMWQHNLGTAERVHLDVSHDDGATWIREASDLPLRGGVTSTYVWRVKGAARSSVRFRVTWNKDEMVSATTPPMAIAAPFLTFTGPPAGSEWGSCDFVVITWNHNLGTREPVDIDTSDDGGRTWDRLETVRSTGALKGRFGHEHGGPEPRRTGFVRLMWASNPSVASIGGPFIFSAHDNCNP